MGVLMTEPSPIPTTRAAMVKAAATSCNSSLTCERRKS